MNETKTHGQKNIRAMLMKALGHQQQGDLKAAETVCREILEIDENQADALQFLGLIEETRGNIDAAEALMRKSLSVMPNQPHVLNNLANLLHDKGDSEKAIELLKKALSLQPAYWDAWYNLGKVYFDLERLPEAEEALIKARDYWQTPIPRAHALLGTLYQRTGEWQKSNLNFQKALAIKPDYFNALHNYGLSLKRQQKSEEALELYARALAVRKDVPELFYNIANAHFDLDHIDLAVENYKKAIELNPDYLDAHYALNEVLWRSGQKDAYTESYREAARRGSTSMALRLQFIDNLIKAERFDEAGEVLSKALEKDPENAKLWYNKAKLFAIQGQPAKTLGAYEKCLALEPDTILYRKDMAKVFIKLDKPEEALKQIEYAHSLEPLDQEILAYLGLCWRLTGNPKEPWLNDFDTFVRAYKIPVPPGYRDLADFNRALNAALDKFHTAKEQPSDQTLRGGTQSIAELLEKNVKEIQEARKSFEATIRQYISDLPDDDSHPLLSRKSDKFTFAGSWSVRLRGKGFHVNHTHPEGWISSSYYVSLPEVVKGGKNQDGWIKFGESPLKLGDQERIGKIVQPEEGLLVLFPSYMFHGTIPFHSKEFRTTLPFDVVPL